ncbi:collagen alpha-1(XV) chain isoform X2 [Columba livia]|uniref:collagen alpha-1(XV) chain isoform X2 n=1 Tax=Columba livia TaxID=8932 RepID=UPI0031BADE9E
MAAMAPLTLSQLLDVAIGTSGDGAVDLPSLHRLLQSMLGHLGLQDLPVLEPGHRPTALLGGHQATKDQPGLEKEEDRAQGTGQQPREPEEHLPGKELLQGTTSSSQVTSLANDVGQMKIAANKSSISKESTGGQSAPAKPPQLDMDQQRGASSALGPKGPGTEPVPRTSKGTPGTQPAALWMQEGAQSTPAPPEKSAGTTSPTTCPLGPFPIGQQSLAHILADIQTQVSSLHGWMSSLQGMDYELQHVKQEVRQLEEAFGKLGLAGADGKAGSSHQIPLQLGSARQEMIQATLEQLVTKRTQQLQEQVDELRAIVESAGQELAGGILDTRVQLAQLVQHVVTSQQDGQLLNHLQACVAQVQGDCDKLRIVLKGLLDHRGQEQKSIEALSRWVERLEMEKADKEELLLGIDAKADKTSLAGKVSQSQFEASVEQLKEKMEELTSRVAGQEQGWHQVQRQLREEMDSKLDRLELGPFRQQLEEQWNSLQEQLEEKVSQAAAGEAAGIKKQLLAHFQSLSCDQPLSMLVPGPEQTDECQHPPVPPSCGDQHTVTPPLQHCLQPHPPSTPRPLQSFARLHSKLRVTQVGLQWRCLRLEWGSVPQFPQGELSVGGLLGMPNGAPCFSQPALSFPAQDDGAVGQGQTQLQGPAGWTAACAGGQRRHHRLLGAQVGLIPRLPGTGALAGSPAPTGCIGTPRAGQDSGSPAAPTAPAPTGRIGTPKARQDWGSPAAPAPPAPEGSIGTPRAREDWGSPAAPAPPAPEGSIGTPRAREDWGSPAEASPHPALSKRGSTAGQHQ